jgi:hypothetical protein
MVNFKVYDENTREIMAQRQWRLDRVILYRPRSFQRALALMIPINIGDSSSFPTMCYFQKMSLVDTRATEAKW